MFNPPNVNQSNSGTGSVQHHRGQCFQYAVPAGWRVLEDGQFAVVLGAPDGSAITVMTGNSGVFDGTDPMQFAWGALSRMQVMYLRFGQPRQAQPMYGCQYAAEFDLSYQSNGMPFRGVGKVSVAPVYGMSTMIVTFAASIEPHWGHYAAWLPRIAESAVSLNGAAFGARGVMAQTMHNTQLEGDLARRCREQSQAQWDQVVQQRGESQDRQHAQFREALGNVQTFYNPYDGRTVELSASDAVYWINRQTGEIRGHPDASYDPRQPVDPNWERMAGPRG